MTVMSEWSFRDELKLSPMNVARSALYLARGLAYPDLDAGAYMAQLDGLVTAVQQDVDPTAPTHLQSDAISTFLFQEYGLRGNQADYYDPRNSFLNDVLDRRLGIPLTLSIIFVHVARRMGLDAAGVSLPGHFIAQVHDDDGDLLYDPFNGGQRISQAACADLVRRTSGYDGPFERAWLNPASPRAILLRLLSNLRMIYVQREAWPEALKVMEHVQMMQPQDPQHLRDLGLLHFQTGSMLQAAQYLEAYMAQHPNSAEVKQIQKNVWAAFDRWVRAN